MDKSNLQIYRNYTLLIAYSNDVVRKYPKSEKFALVQEIKQTLYQGLRSLMYAIKVYDKKEKLAHLNELDQFIKRELKVKYYVRYMDDFVLLLKDKKECKKTKDIIEKFLSQNLLLELNEKSRYYPNKMGVNFCGYRIFVNYRKLRNNSFYFNILIYSYQFQSSKKTRKSDS